MRQIMINLITNAIKYSAAAKSIQVSLSGTPETLVLQVRDEGIGIPAIDLPYVYEPFRRGSNVGAIPGTGLGLTITKEAIELHGGTISLESQVGVGTTFTVYLPIANRGEKPQQDLSFLLSSQSNH